MGQYFIPMNLTTREFINPHRLGDGLKLIEQATNTTPGGTLAALHVLLAMPGHRGHEVIGRWAGGQVAIVGDYAEDDDMPDSPIPLSLAFTLTDKGATAERIERIAQDLADPSIKGDQAKEEARYAELDELQSPFTDISDLVREHYQRLGVTYTGDGWADRAYDPARRQLGVGS